MRRERRYSRNRPGVCVCVCVCLCERVCVFVCVALDSVQCKCSCNVCACNLLIGSQFQTAMSAKHFSITLSQHFTSRLIVYQHISVISVAYMDIVVLA